MKTTNNDLFDIADLAGFKITIDNNSMDIKSKFRLGDKSTWGVLFLFFGGSFLIAASGDYCFKIYFKNGFTYRDDAVLRFVNFVSDGSTSLASIVQQYSGILTETEVRDTVLKMEKAGCLTIEGEIVQTTDVTRKLL